MKRKRLTTRAKTEVHGVRRRNEISNSRLERLEKILELLG